MVSNPERRAALLDAAIEVLADQGARGLTFRAVDARAGVPVGTTSNYFTGRDELLSQVGGHVYVRFAPEQAELEAATTGEPSPDRVAQMMRRLVRRLVSRRTVYLALLELRLEATRRADLRDMLTRRVREDLESNVAFHDDVGLPGGRSAVVMLYLAISGLLVEHLTLPGVLADDGPAEALVDEIVQRVMTG